MVEPWSGKTIVIVDDSEQYRRYLEDFYSSSGLKVIGQFSSGVDAVEKIPDLHPDLVSLDIIMPEMDGIECYFLTKERYAPANVFFVSALSLENRVVSVYSEDIPPSSFLPKPIEKETFESYLKALYGKAGEP